MPAATATVNAASSAKRKASTSKAPSTAAAGSRSASVSSTTSAGKSKSKGKAVAPTKAGSDQVDAGGALIDGHVSQSQVEKAVKALQAHRKRAQAEDEKHQLPLSGHDDVEGEGARADPADVLWLMVTTKTINENAPPKPVRITLPNAVYAPSSSVCLITKDPQRQYKDLLASAKVKQVKRVVGVTKLKGKFAPFDARRQLMNDHEVFLADDRIVEMLPKLLGKRWIQERKSPLPVKLSGRGETAIKGAIEQALSSTYYHRNRGVCTATRIGTLSHLSTEQLLANVAGALPAIVGKHVKGGWENMQNIEIKTGKSAGLPVWNCKMSERWNGMPTEEEEEARKKARKEARSQRNMDEAQWYKEYGQDADEDEEDEEGSEAEEQDEEEEEEDEEDEEDEGDIEQEEARARKVQKKSSLQSASSTKKGKK